MGSRDRKKREARSKLILEEWSPNCKIQALVEVDDRCAYLYLLGNPGYEDQFIKSCWIRNFKEAPVEIDREAFNQGKAPMMMREACKMPEGAPRLLRDELRFIWFEEGDGVALFEGNQILAVIPEWADEDFHGYARDCIKESLLAWPLGEITKRNLSSQLSEAEDYWCYKEDETFWHEKQEEYLRKIESTYGKVRRYYGIDCGNWPIKSMITVEQGAYTYILTLGVSLLKQPKVYIDNPGQYRRFELAFAIRTELFVKNKEGILSYISSQTNLPWRSLTWLGHLHTLPCDQIEGFPYMLLVSHLQEKGLPRLSYPHFRGDPINVLWMVPITEKERTLAIEQGSQRLLEMQVRGPLWQFNGASHFKERGNKVGKSVNDKSLSQ